MLLLVSEMNPQSDNAAVNPMALDPKLVRRRFDVAADSFDQADFLHRETEEGLLERLQPLTLQPKLILDCGCATGGAAKTLLAKYRPDRLICGDISARMLAAAKRKRGWFSKQREVQLDAGRLPFASDCIDLIFANLLLPWLDDAPAFFSEVARVLRPGGVFAFSSLGPDSLSEVRTAWTSVDNEQHVHRFPDMHNVGDELMRCGLSNPVLDVDYQNVSYRDFDRAVEDLTAVGGRNSLKARQKSLASRERLAQFRQNLAARGALEFRLELVFGHAFGGAGNAQEFRISPQGIGRRS